MSSGPHTRDDEVNLDPMSGASGSHPIGTGIGAALGGTAAGAAAGIVAGPVGAIIGAALGAVIGGLAGKDFAEVTDPAQTDAYWHTAYIDRPYVERGSSYDDYRPAYAFGANAAGRYPGRIFDDVEPEMSQAWSSGSDASTLPWDSARHAARDAWNRVVATS